MIKMSLHAAFISLASPLKLSAGDFKANFKEGLKAKQTTLNLYLLKIYWKVTLIYLHGTQLFHSATFFRY